jgi:RNA polymerase subunit RPABC4/transcription elongation factor Spt4
MTQPTTSNAPLSEYIRHVLLKSNKKCTGCNMICFEDEATCPECHGYLFIPYTKHLENYSPVAQVTEQEKVEIFSEIDLL